MTLYDRYMNGETETVFGDIESMGKMAFSPDNFSDIEKVLNEAFERVAFNLDIIYKELVNINYLFKTHFEYNFQKPLHTLMKRVHLIILIVSICQFGRAQSWEDTVLLIEKKFDRYKSTNPGAQFAVGRNGKIIFSKAWGIADLEHNIPLTTESILEAGSVSKQFTAGAILLLEQQGKFIIG